MVSRPESDILQEIERLVVNGYREIVLTGIHLGHYGVDRNRARPRAEWERLATLVERICRLPGDFRIRLSSIEATEVTRQLLDIMASRPDRICPHLHVCLQSDSDAVLRRMDRRWGAQRFIDRCRLAQEYLADPALTTDVIVGFPGESEDDFHQTLEVCRTVGFSKIHIFPFSGRRGTPAANFGGHVPPDAKSDRCQRLATLETELRDRYFDRLLDRPLQMMVESVQPDSDGLLGTACRYAPLSVNFGGSESPTGIDRHSEPRSNEVHPAERRTLRSADMLGDLSFRIAPADWLGKLVPVRPARRENGVIMGSIATV